MVRRRRRTALGGLALMLAVTACEDPMEQHPRHALAPADPIVAGSVPRGALDRTAALAAPTRPIDLATLQEGRDLYDWLCSACHGRTGRGDGMVVRHGFPQPPSFHAERLQRVSLERIVKVITQGSGDMYPYANQTEPEERWAIAAYVKALQLSQGLPLDALPAEDRLLLPEEDE
jgi:mono/diheme cytochrome c family protein